MMDEISKPNPFPASAIELPHKKDRGCLREERPLLTFIFENAIFSAKIEAF